MKNIVTKASNNQPLTPSQRALLRLLKSLGIAAFVTLVGVLTQAILSGKVIDSVVIYSGLMAAGYAVLQGLAKYFSALGDTEMQATFTSAATLDSAAYNKLSGGMKLDNVVDTTSTDTHMQDIAHEYESSKGTIEQPQATNEAAPTVQHLQVAPEVVEGVQFDTGTSVASAES